MSRNNSKLRLLCFIQFLRQGAVNKFHRLFFISHCGSIGRTIWVTICAEVLWRMNIYSAFCHCHEKTSYVSNFALSFYCMNESIEGRCTNYKNFSVYNSDFIARSVLLKFFKVMCLPSMDPFMQLSEKRISWHIGGLFVTTIYCYNKHDNNGHCSTKKQTMDCDQTSIKMWTAADIHLRSGAVYSENNVVSLSTIEQWQKRFVEKLLSVDNKDQARGLSNTMNETVWCVHMLHNEDCWYTVTNKQTQMAVCKNLTNKTFKII